MRDYVSAAEVTEARASVMEAMCALMDYLIRPQEQGRDADLFWKLSNELSEAESIYRHLLNLFERDQRAVNQQDKKPETSPSESAHNSRRVDRQDLALS